MGAPFVWFDLTVADGAKVVGFYQRLLAGKPGQARAITRTGCSTAGSHGREPSQREWCPPGAGFPTLRWVTSTPP